MHTVLHVHAHVCVSTLRRLKNLCYHTLTYHTVMYNFVLGGHTHALLVLEQIRVCMNDRCAPDMHP